MILVLVLVLLLLLLEEVVVDMITMMMVVDMINDGITVDMTKTVFLTCSTGRSSGGTCSRTTNTMMWVTYLVRKRDDSVRFILMGANLVAHKPSHTTVFAAITYQIRERNANFPERFIAEKLVLQNDVQVEVIVVFLTN